MDKQGKMQQYKKNNSTNLTRQYKRSWWRLGVVVSVVGRINEVNQHRARLVHDG